MFKVLDEVCQPTRATKYSAMVDLYAREDVVIGAGETKIVPLGVKIDLDFLKNRIGVSYALEKWKNVTKDINRAVNLEFEEFLKSNYLELHPRSSLRAKGLIIGVGVIDLDYPDEIGLIVHNAIKHSGNGIAKGANNQNKYFINKGDKVAQCTLKEHKGYLLGIESEVERTGGFGSTDK